MAANGYRGISFPFRVGVKGGVVMSDTTMNAPTHIVESMTQILQTAQFERTMEPDIYSEVDAGLFEPGDSSLLNLLAYQCVEALKKEPRVKVGIKDIKLSVTDNTVNANISYYVPSLGSNFETTVEVGELS